MGRRMLVLEARRLLPLLFLLVLLVSLSVYDSVSTRPAAVLQGVEGKEVEFSTVDKGTRKEKARFELVLQQEVWDKLSSEWEVSLPHYPFRPQHEVALFVLHAQVQKIQAAAAGTNDIEITVTVKPRQDAFHVIVLPAKDVIKAGGEAKWLFTDRRGKELGEIVLEEGSEKEVK